MIQPLSWTRHRSGCCCSPVQTLTFHHLHFAQQHIGCVAMDAVLEQSRIKKLLHTTPCLDKNKADESHAFFQILYWRLRKFTQARAARLFFSKLYAIIAVPSPCVFYGYFSSLHKRNFENPVFEEITAHNHGACRPILLHRIRCCLLHIVYHLHSSQSCLQICSTVYFTSNNRLAYYWR